MTVSIVDTTVFCNLLEVPNLCGQTDRAFDELDDFVERDCRLLLPVATIYETGNHIAQNGGGTERRQAAERFSDQVRQAFAGEAAWTPTPIHAEEDLLGWLDDFRDYAMRGVGLADVSIIRIFEEQCRLHPTRRVFIWSYDGDLNSYDRRP